MKLEVLQENLTKALTTVSRATAGKPSLPILSHVLLSAQKGKLSLLVSNLETTILALVGAKVETEGEFTVPVKTLGEIIAGLAAEKVSLHVTEGALVVTTGSFKTKINGLPAADFPRVINESDREKKGDWVLAEKELKEITGKVAFAAAADESRAALTAVLFRFDKNSLVLAAADGFRLSRLKLPKPKGMDLEGDFLLPAKVLTEAARLTGEVSVGFLPESNQVVFATGEVRIYSRLIAGNFPDFEKIIPAENTLRVIVATDEFTRALRLAAVFARESANIVKFKIAAERGNSAQSAQFPNFKFKIAATAQVGENEGEVEAKFEKGGASPGGEASEFVIAFNYRYLLDFLVGAASQETIMEFNTALTPGVFKLPGRDDFLHLIMPVRVQS